MKCYADERDICHNITMCERIGNCFYEKQLNATYEESKKNGSPEFYSLLEQMGSIHSRKSHDYAQASNPFSNFERASLLASWFTDPVDIAFAVLIGVKLARLAELSTGKTPNNESIEDTHLDGATYMTLWAAYKKEKAKKNEILAREAQQF